MKFKPEDFNITRDVPTGLAFPQEIYAWIANKKLQEWLDKAPTVYTYVDPTAPEGYDMGWWKTRIDSQLKQYRAKLVCIEEIDDKRKS